MAEDKSARKAKTTADKKNKQASFMDKFVDFFRRLPGRVASPFKSTWRELKKVTWPSRESLWQYTGIVIAFMAFMGLVIGLLDLGASKLIAAIVGA
ncbi:MAG: preprotein translocase subunit SecE [Eubacteriales bacterium]|nr:preprotein translocase subunit SecE [Eubacteriales bacterium]